MINEVSPILVMEEWHANGDANPMPFDGARMIFGGFRVVVDE